MDAQDLIGEQDYFLSGPIERSKRIVDCHEPPMPDCLLEDLAEEQGEYLPEHTANKQLKYATATA